MKEYPVFATAIDVFNSLNMNERKKINRYVVFI